MRAGTRKKTKSLTQTHREMVRGLLADPAPAPAILPAPTQWALWIMASALVMVAALGLVHVQPGLGAAMRHMPPLAFTLLAFAGSALAAWEAIASSVPGRRTGRAYRAAALAVLAALFALPFFCFTPNDGAFHPLAELGAGWGCFTLVSLVGLPPWLLLGWLVSRNAAFQPAWTGAWTGASAFLLGTTTVQLHCPDNHWGHVLMAHLLPVAVFTLAASWAGLHWFARWKKKA